MTVLSAIQGACTVLGLDVPGAVYSSPQREHVELGELANEMAQRIAETHDWTKLKVLATFTGDGSDTSFPLPSDYKRMLKKARVWSSDHPYDSLVHYPDTDQWLGMEIQNFQTIIGGWTLIGENMEVKPALASAATAKFYYITDLIVSPASGDNKTGFTVDTDSFRLSERLLKLGIIWQWRASKGLPYAEHMSSYEDALGVEIGNDKGSNILVVGRQRLPFDAEFAYPGSIVP